MDFMIVPDSVNQVPEGAFIAKASEPVNCVFLVLKGKLGITNGSCSISFAAGSFVALNAIFSGTYAFSIFAKENSSVYAFKVKNSNTVTDILNKQKDYAGMAVWSLARAVTEMERLSAELVNKANGLGEHIKLKHDEYLNKTKLAGFTPTEIKLVNQLKTYEKIKVENQELLDYYSELAAQPIDRSKLFFADCPNMAIHHLREEAILLNELGEICKETSSFLESASYLLINKGNDNLYMKTTELLSRLKSLNKETSGAQQLLEEIKDSILQIAIFFEQHLNRSLEIDMDRMEDAYINALSGSGAPGDETAINPGKMDAEAVSILRKSLANGAGTLVSFAGWQGERADSFVNNIEQFVKSKNKLSADENSRSLRKSISNHFIELYMDVFLRSLNTPSLPEVARLFLDYGFVDERLLSDNQLAELCSLKSEKPTTPCAVYTFREWLSMLFDMRRIPSKSEMDVDFEEYLREKRKHGELTDEQLAKIAKDPVQWVSYEIHNMFATNERLVNGQMTTFVPVLNSESFNGSPLNTKMTKDRINALVSQVLSTDPTAFHREIVYNNSEAKIEREIIVKCVYPEFIIMPINGSNIVMWQDTSGRKRDSAARFVVPCFYEGMPEDSMIRAIGRLRWELCKTIQSVSWNNIQVKSLTSEYFDYIEYYRKNHDLSEEKREKLKSQITKARNNLREVFVQDYECWIKYESNGAIRMNKVAREILATYIPFPKSIRLKIQSQPIFSEAMARFERNLTKKNTDLDIHYKNLEKNNIVPSSEMLATKEYYKNI